MPKVKKPRRGRPPLVKAKRVRTPKKVAKKSRGFVEPTRAELLKFHAKRFSNKHQQVSDEQKQLRNNIEFLMNQNKIINSNLKTIYTIWDRVFKTVGAIFSVGVMTTITVLLRSLYYTNGKWLFGWVFFYGVIYVMAVVLLTLLIWKIINKALINKIERMSC